tara:strand:- start:243 stop:554 length:312 start_codon:yes stop_codon:yes gene_type:complete
MPKTELGMNDTRDPINAEENTGEVSNLMIIQMVENIPIPNENISKLISEILSLLILIGRFLYPIIGINPKIENQPIAGINIHHKKSIWIEASTSSGIILDRDT